MSGEEKRSRARSGEIHPVTLAAVNDIGARSGHAFAQQLRRGARVETSLQR